MVYTFSALAKGTAELVFIYRCDPITIFSHTQIYFLQSSETACMLRTGHSEANI